MFGKREGEIEARASGYNNITLTQSNRRSLWKLFGLKCSQIEQCTKKWWNIQDDCKGFHKTELIKVFI